MEWKRRSRSEIARLAIASALMMTVIGASGAFGGQPPRKTDDVTTHDHGSTSDRKGGRKLVRKLARPVALARAATAKYVVDLEAAEADGYRIITQHIPDMGYHLLNPDITEFDITQPPILVYLRSGDDWQLGAVEWVFPEKPKKKPLPGATYGSFGAACHYDDGTFVFEGAEEACPEVSPESGSTFVFWHPDLVTMHLWIWYPNPDGPFNGTNRWVRPFNAEQL